VTSSHPFEFDAAPYVLGALDVAGRAAFESHLAQCADCRADVASLRRLTPMLTTLDEQAYEPSPVPDTLLPRLMRAVDAGRRRRSRRAWALSAVAACLALLLGIFAVPRLADNGPTRLALHAATSDSPVHAKVALSPSGDRTKLELTCRYDQDTPWGVATYRLVVTNHAGERLAVSHWTIEPGQTVTIDATAPWPRANMRNISIETDDGRAVLELNL